MKVNNLPIVELRAIVKKAISIIICNKQIADRVYSVVIGYIEDCLDEKGYLIKGDMQNG